MGFLNRSGKPKRRTAKYMQGYTAVKVPKPGGKGFSVEYVYTSMYWRPDVPDGKWWQSKRLYVGLYTLSVAGWLAGMLSRVPSNAALYVALPGLLAGLGLLVMLASLVNYVRAGGKMTAWEYKAGPVRLRLLGFVVACLLAAAAVAVLVFSLVDPLGDPGREALVMMCYGVGALAALAPALAEGRVRYVQVPNPGGIQMEGEEL